MNPSPTNIASVARLEVRNAARLARFWVVAFTLILCSIVGYVLSCLFLVSLAPVSPSHGGETPFYLLGNIEPTFFLMFQAAVLFLIFDAAHQHTRNSIDEVLNSKPITNLEYLTGRVLGIAGSVWFIVAANLLAMQVFGLVANATDFDFGDTLQFHSVINLLLVDAPATLVFWGAFFVFLSQLLRFRLLVIAVGLATVLGWYTLVLEVPYSLLGVVSPSSNDTLFVSDLIPEFASWSSVVIRLATVFLAGTLLLLTSTLPHRWDTAALPVSLSAAAVLLLVCVVSFSVGAWSVVEQFSKPQKWNEVHANYNWDHRMDISRIEGNIGIEPGKRLEFDLTIHFDVDEDASSPLVFTLNPAMDITRQELDGQNTEYAFQDGLLEIEIPYQLTGAESHSLRIVASGVPDPRFAYFDSQVDYITDPDIQAQAVSMFGQDGSVFHSNFVALMPGSYWYPHPGVVDNRFSRKQNGTDYFDLDVQVELKQEDWTVVGTGAPLAKNENSTFRLQPENPVSEIGLFASDFRTDSFRLGEIELSLYLHRRHTRNLSVLSLVEDALQSEMSDLLDSLNGKELEVVHKSLAFVEVPRRLRMVSGGWRMDSVDSLPGIVLVKEHGFPTARLDRIFQSIDKEEPEDSPREELHLEIVAQYFGMGVATDNPWTSLPNRLWSHGTSATGELSHILDQIMLSLVSLITNDGLHPFSVYWALNVLDVTQLSLFGSSYGVEDAISEEHFSSQGLWRTLQRIEDDYLTRISTFSNLTNIALPELPTSNGNQQDFELLMLKCSEIARALLDANGSDKIAAWIGAVRKEHFGGNFTYNDLLQAAEKHEVIVDPFLIEWIHTSKLPGYAVSPIEVVRMEDDTNGSPQYQTSVHVRNMEDVAGYVRLRYPDERSREWRYPILTSSKAVRVDGHSSTKINLVTGYEPRMVHFDPGLSLNRNEMDLIRSSPLIEERLDSAVKPFEEQSSWQPTRHLGIIVDDLDPGFVVFQTNPNLNRKTRAGPLGWFREPRMAGELDNGIPWFSGNYYPFEYRWRPGLWHRQSVAFGFGRFRTTATYILVRKGLEIPKAVFGAEVPEAGQWTLDYYFPPRGMEGSGDKAVYELNVTDGSTTNPISVNVADLRRGWNKIGEFDLVAGTVHVEFVGVSDTWAAVADAIRWTKTEQH